MIFVDKGPCPQEIQEDIDAQKAKDGWDEIPEIPNCGRRKRTDFNGKQRGFGKNSLMRLIKPAYGQNF